MGGGKLHVVFGDFLVTLEIPKSWLTEQKSLDRKGSDGCTLKPPNQFYKKYSLLNETDGCMSYQVVEHYHINITLIKYENEKP